MQKVLITGGAGYLGSILATTLLAHGYSVRVLDSMLFHQNSLLDCCANPNFEFIQGDARDATTVKKAIKDCDWVIPLAALVGAPMCNKDKIAAKTLNQDAIALLLSELSPNQRVLYPTTNSGYGIGQKDKFCTEETPLQPISLYGETKCAAEKMVLERKNSITFRLATVFGASPRMRMDLLVNEFVYRAVKDRSIVIFEGHFKRNFIHIRDVARAFMHGMKNFEQMKNEPYNVGLSTANLSKLELCDIIKKFVPSFVVIEAPIGEDPDKRDYIVSNAKIEKTGFKPEHSLEMGIQELSKVYQILQANPYGNV